MEAERVAALREEAEQAFELAEKAKLQALQARQQQRQAEADYLVEEASRSAEKQRRLRKSEKSGETPNFDEATSALEQELRNDDTDTQSENESGETEHDGSQADANTFPQVNGASLPGRKLGSGPHDRGGRWSPATELPSTARRQLPATRTRGPLTPPTRRCVSRLHSDSDDVLDGSDFAGQSFTHAIGESTPPARSPQGLSRGLATSWSGPAKPAALPPRSTARVGQSSRKPFPQRLRQSPQPGGNPDDDPKKEQFALVDHAPISKLSPMRSVDELGPVDDDQQDAETTSMLASPDSPLRTTVRKVLQEHGLRTEETCGAFTALLRTKERHAQQIPSRPAPRLGFEDTLDILPPSTPVRAARAVQQQLDQLLKQRNEHNAKQTPSPIHVAQSSPTAADWAVSDSYIEKMSRAIQLSRQAGATNEARSQAHPSPNSSSSLLGNVDAHDDSASSHDVGATVRRLEVFSAHLPIAMSGMQTLSVGSTGMAVSEQNLQFVPERVGDALERGFPKLLNHEKAASECPVLTVEAVAPRLTPFGVHPGDLVLFVEGGLVSTEHDFLVAMQAAIYRCWATETEEESDQLVADLSDRDSNIARVSVVFGRPYGHGQFIASDVLADFASEQASLSSLNASRSPSFTQHFNKSADLLRRQNRRRQQRNRFDQHAAEIFNRGNDTDSDESQSARRRRSSASSRRNTGGSGARSQRRGLPSENLYAIAVPDVPRVHLHDSNAAGDILAFVGQAKVTEQNTKDTFPWTANHHSVPADLYGGETKGEDGDLSSVRIRSNAFRPSPTISNSLRQSSLDACSLLEKQIVPVLLRIIGREEKGRPGVAHPQSASAFAFLGRRGFPSSPHFFRWLSQVDRAFNLAVAPSADTPGHRSQNHDVFFSTGSAAAQLRELAGTLKDVLGGSLSPGGGALTILQVAYQQWTGNQNASTEAALGHDHKAPLAMQERIRVALGQFSLDRVNDVITDFFAEDNPLAFAHLLQRVLFDVRELRIRLRADASDSDIVMDSGDEANLQLERTELGHGPMSEQGNRVPFGEVDQAAQHIQENLQSDSSDEAYTAGGSSTGAFDFSVGSESSSDEAIDRSQFGGAALHSQVDGPKIAARKVHPEAANPLTRQRRSERAEPNGSPAPANQPGSTPKSPRAQSIDSKIADLVEKKLAQMGIPLEHVHPHKTQFSPQSSPRGAGDVMAGDSDEMEDQSSEIEPRHNQTRMRKHALPGSDFVAKFVAARRKLSPATHRSASKINEAPEQPVDSLRTDFSLLESGLSPIRPTERPTYKLPCPEDKASTSSSAPNGSCCSTLDPRLWAEEEVRKARSALTSKDGVVVRNEWAVNDNEDPDSKAAREYGRHQASAFNANVLQPAALAARRDASHAAFAVAAVLSTQQLQLSTAASAVEQAPEQPSHRSDDTARDGNFRHSVAAAVLQLPQSRYPANKGALSNAEAAFVALDRNGDGLLSKGEFCGVDGDSQSSVSPRPNMRPRALLPQDTQKSGHAAPQLHPHSSASPHTPPLRRRRPESTAVECIQNIVPPPSPWDAVNTASKGMQRAVATFVGNRDNASQALSASNQSEESGDSACHDDDCLKAEISVSPEHGNSLDFTWDTVNNANVSMRNSIAAIAATAANEDSTNGAALHRGFTETATASTSSMDSSSSVDGKDSDLDEASWLRSPTRNTPVLPAWMSQHLSAAASFAALDADGDGVVSKDEFLSAVSRASTQAAAQQRLADATRQAEAAAAAATAAAVAAAQSAQAARHVSIVDKSPAIATDGAVHPAKAVSAPSPWDQLKVSTTSLMGVIDSLSFSAHSPIRAAVASVHVEETAAASKEHPLSFQERHDMLFAHHGVGEYNPDSAYRAPLAPAPWHMQTRAGHSRNESAATLPPLPTTLHSRQSTRDTYGTTDGSTVDLGSSSDSDGSEDDDRSLTSVESSVRSDTDDKRSASAAAHALVSEITSTAEHLVGTSGEEHPHPDSDEDAVAAATAAVLARGDDEASAMEASFSSAANSDDESSTTEELIATLSSPRFDPAARRFSTANRGTNDEKQRAYNSSVQSRPKADSFHNPTASMVMAIDQVVPSTEVQRASSGLELIKQMDAGLL